MTFRRRARLAIAVAGVLQAVPLAAAQRERAIGAVIEVAPRASPRPAVDRSGRARQGEASVVTNPALASASAVGISGILPEGTTARVQNLQNGRSTLVRVLAGGEASAGRLLDITPPVARALGLPGSSARVLVAPLAVPQPDGTMRLGEGTQLAGTTAAMALSNRPTD